MEFVAVLMLVSSYILFLFAIPWKDKEKIEKEINEEGGKLISCEKIYFSFGIASHKLERIYKFHYLDIEGNEHKGYANFCILRGLYFSIDEIIKFPSESKKH